MWRWPLSTVRTFGGLDSHSIFPKWTLRPARLRFRCAYIDTAVSIVDNPAVTSSSTRTYPDDPQDASRLGSTSIANVFGHCSRRTDARNRTHGSAIDALRQCLSSDNLNHPLICSPTVIRSLFYSAESSGQLEMLDSKMLSLLIGLFGSLSIDPHQSSLYGVPLASRLSTVSTRRTHWAFVLKVGKYKSGRGMSLHDSDRFWLMRAELAIVRASPSEPLSDDVYRAALRARAHYLAVRRHSRHPEVHVSYLEALLAIRDPRLLDLTSRDLSYLLRTHDVCHPWLQRLLYRLVIQHGGYLSTQSQEVILASLWGRVCRGTDKATDIVPENGIPDIYDCNSDATAIARSVSATLFGFPTQPRRGEPAIIHLLSVFCPTYALPLRWSSLTLLSIFNSSETIHLGGAHWTDIHMMSRVASYWQIIFGLAMVDKILRDPPIALERQSRGEILETTRFLHQRLLSVINSPSIVPNLIRAVATSFLRVANILEDVAVFRSCRDLHIIGNNVDGPRTSVPQLFATQYIAAAVRAQGLLPDAVFTMLEDFFPDQKQQDRALASVVEALAHFDSSRAYALYVSAQKKGMKPNTGAACALAMSFARHGALHQTISLVNNSQFSPEARGMLLSVIARSLRENPRTRHPQRVLIAIVKELAALYHSLVPPEHFRGHLEQLFVVLARNGRGSQLFPAVLSISSRSPSFFRPRFFDRYCRALIQHRQIFTARKLLNIITATHPKIVRRLRILVDRIAVQTRASRTLQHTLRRGPTSLKLSSRLRRCLDAKSPLEHSLEELLRSGRVLAAKHIFTRAVATVPRARCTALGNILIHGVAHQPTPRNGRRVRKVLALLENLVKNYDFRPDRVTANILIKAMISWRSAFDSPRLRSLFDHIVRVGYPAGDYSPVHSPFGTPQMQFSSSLSFSELPSAISFEKHSRPLFKMFIKAFYSCNDVEAARTVVGILKVEEYKNAMAKETRRRARSKGRIKAAQRNVP